MKDSELLEEVIKIAQTAGQAVMVIYDEADFDISRKVDDSPLTKADIASHNIIVSELAKLTDYPIISEEGDSFETKSGSLCLDAALGGQEERAKLTKGTESEPADTALRQESAGVSNSAGQQGKASQKPERFWLVDPLDGTKEFIKQRGEFTVNIALIENQAPVMGVVYAPAIGVLYAGARDKGAFKLENGRKRSIKAVFGSGTPKVVTSKSHRTPETDDFLAKIGRHQEVSIGSSLKLCLVAEGKAMLYPRLGPTYGWDTAAGDAVVRAAGGTVNDMDGKHLVYLPSASKNPDFVACSKDSVSFMRYY